MTIDYGLDVDCSAAEGEYTDQGLETTIGEWPFDRKEEALTRRFGQNWPPNSTPMACASDELLATKDRCSIPESLEPTAGAPSHFGAEEDPAGTSAHLEWSWAGLTGRLEETEIDLDLRHSIVQCDHAKSGNCLKLAALTASTDSTYAVDGSTIQLSDLQLQIVGQEKAGIPLGRRDSFKIAPGSLESLVSFQSSERGATSVSLKNAAEATGRISPTSGALTIRGLVFNFGGLGFEARLTLDITANYTERPPETSIAIVEAPRDCASPMVFRGISNDLDGGELHHHWWSNKGNLGDGPLLEAVLPAGPNFVVLTTSDAEGNFSTDNVEIDRRCE